jgi:hypothetical protein
MKVIFLDIDGVLNCDKTPNPRKFPYIVDKKLLVRLRKLLDRTGAKVVLSSTWRCDPVGLFAAKHWGVLLRSITDQWNNFSVRALYRHYGTPNVVAFIFDQRQHPCLLIALSDAATWNRRQPRPACGAPFLYNLLRVPSAIRDSK